MFENALDTLRGLGQFVLAFALLVQGRGHVLAQLQVLLRDRTLGQLHQLCQFLVVERQVRFAWANYSF